MQCLGYTYTPKEVKKKGVLYFIWHSCPLPVTQFTAPFTSLSGSGGAPPPLTIPPVWMPLNLILFLACLDLFLVHLVLLILLHNMHTFFQFTLYYCLTHLYVNWWCCGGARGQATREQISYSLMPETHSFLSITSLVHQLQLFPILKAGSGTRTQYWALPCAAHESHKPPLPY